MIKLMSAGVEGSTLIKHISWADNVLTVLFHNGKAFAYDNVPMFVFSALAESDSAGKFFNMFIRKTYSGGPAQCIVWYKTKPIQLRHAWQGQELVMSLGYPNPLRLA